jgi:hypothetical protein
MLNSRLRLPVALALAAALAPGLALADYSFPSYMSTAEEVPTPTGGASARATGSITLVEGVNGVQDTVLVNITYSGLSSNNTAAHIHGVASRGATAGVLIALPIVTGNTAGSIVGALPVTPFQRNAILSGQTYTNIHTVNNGAGEIRGQIDSVTLVGKGVPGSSPNGLILLTLALAGTAVVVLSRRKLTA